MTISKPAARHHEKDYNSIMCQTISQSLNLNTSREMDIVRGVTTLIKIGGGMTNIESSLAASLVSRLILRFCTSRTIVQDTSTLPYVNFEEAQDGITQPSTSQIASSAINCDSPPGNKVPDKDGVMSNSGESKPNAHDIAPMPVDCRNAQVDVIGGKREKTNSFTYYNNQYIQKGDSATDAVLTGIATKLGKALVSSSNKTKDKTVIASKEIASRKINNTIDTVAGALSKFLVQLEKANAGGYLLTGLTKLIPTSNGVSKSKNPLIGQTDLQYTLVAVLRSVLIDIRSSVEAFQDFDYLWKSCIYKYSLFRRGGLFDYDEDSETTAKECVWILSSLVHLHCLILDDRIFYDKNTSKGDKLGTDHFLKRRKERIICTAACISLTFQDVLKSQITTDTSSEQNDSQEPDAKRRRKDELAINGMQQVYSSGSIFSAQDEKISLGSSISENKNSLEDDAIAALSMMVTGSATSSSSTSSSTDITPSLCPTNSSKEHSHSTGNTDDITEFLVCCANDLLSCLTSSMDTTESIHSLFVTRADIEKNMSATSQHINKFYALRLNPNIHVAAKNMDKPQPVGKKEDDTKLKKEGNNHLMDVTTQNKDDRPRIGLTSDIGVATAKDSTTSDKLINTGSYIDQRDRRESNRGVLRKIYQEIMNLLSERIKRDKDDLSLIRHFKYVEETLLCGMPTEDLQQALIQFQCLSNDDAHDKFNMQVMTRMDLAVICKPPNKFSGKQQLSNTLNHKIINLSQTYPENSSHNVCSSTSGSSYPMDRVIASTVPSVPQKSDSDMKTSRTPPGFLIPESMELIEWAHTILFLASTGKPIKPSTRLIIYLDSSCSISKGATNCYKSMLRENVNSEGPEWSQVIIRVINRALQRLVQQSSETDGTVSVDEYGKVISRLNSVKESSHFLPQQVDITQEILGKALVALYYHSLESILFYETKRLKSASHPKLVMSVQFHRALLSICYTCLVKASGGASIDNSKITHLISGDLLGRSIDVHSVLQIMECTAYEYLKVSEAFVRSVLYFDCSGKSSSLRSTSDIYRNDSSCLKIGLPLIIRRHLQETEELILDSLLWSSVCAENGNDEHIDTIIDVIEKLTEAGEQGSDCNWPPQILEPSLPQEKVDGHEFSKRRSSSQESCILSKMLLPEYNYVTYLLRKFLSMTSQRIAALCSSLEIPPQYPVAAQIWVTFRHLLRHHIQLLFDRHVDQIILCTVYGVCKIMKFSPELSFAKIISVYTNLNKNRLGEKVCQRIIRHIKLHRNEEERKNVDFEKEIYDKSGQVRKGLGNVIHLYNQIYVPTMKNHLLQSKSMKDASLRLKKCMAEGNAKHAIKTVHDAAEMADKSYSSMKGNHLDPLAQKHSLPTSTHHENSSVRIQDTNFFVNITSQVNGRISNYFKKFRKGSSWSSFSPKSRMFYDFGDSRVQDISLINRMINHESSNPY